MKKLMLVASILFASSTAANAWPWQWRGDVIIHSNDEGYPRGDEGYRPYNREGRWIQLGNQMFTQSDRQALSFSQMGEPIRRLRITATRGAPFVHRVLVRYMDGS